MPSTTGFVPYTIRFWTHVRRSIRHARNALPPSPSHTRHGKHRHIELDVSRKHPLIDDSTSEPYIDNRVVSSRYTIWNFLPIQLVVQFSKLANLYFLCVSIVQVIPSVSTTGRYTTLVPLVIFVGISMLREASYDLRRAKLDKQENMRKTSVAKSVADGSSDNTAQWVEIMWQDVRVGDVIQVIADMPVPTDIVLLHVDGNDGLAYIETTALDGETALKRRRAPLLVSRMYGQDTEATLRSRTHFVIERPNLDLNNLVGSLSFGGETSALTNNDIVYRGSTLRNTHKIIGMALYTGEDCKIRMNAAKNPHVKAPTLQFAVNKIVVLVAGFVVVLTLINAMASQLCKRTTRGHAFYLSNAGVAFFQLLASYFLMFNPMIPLALYISLEIVKGVQASMMMDDLDMYDEASDTPLEPRTSTINEELGQVR
jgi:phospholipid-translocating ATPase